jgi:hypothetical protein
MPYRGVRFGVLARGSIRKQYPFLADHVIQIETEFMGKAIAEHLDEI